MLGKKYVFVSKTLPGTEGESLSWRWRRFTLFRSFHVRQPKAEKGRAHAGALLSGMVDDGGTVSRPVINRLAARFSGLVRSLNMSEEGAPFDDDAQQQQQLARVLRMSCVRCLPWIPFSSPWHCPKLSLIACAPRSQHIWSVQQQIHGTSKLLWSVVWLRPSLASSRTSCSVSCKNVLVAAATRAAGWTSFRRRKG